jgi:hypothetical protein
MIADSISMYLRSPIRAILASEKVNTARLNKLLFRARTSRSRTSNIQHLSGIIPEEYLDLNRKS